MLSIFRKSYTILLITIIMLTGISYAKYQVIRSSTTTVSSLSDDQILSIEIIEVTYEEEVLNIKTEITNLINSEPLSIQVELNNQSEPGQTLYNESIEVTNTMEMIQPLNISADDLVSIRTFAIRGTALNGYVTCIDEIDNPYYNDSSLNQSPNESISENMLEDVSEDVREDVSEDVNDDNIENVPND